MSAISNGMKYFVLFTVLLIVFIFGYLGPLSVSPNKSDSLNQERLVNEIVRKTTDCNQLLLQPRWECLETLAKELLRDYPLGDILTAINSARDERVIFNNCHRLGHFLGREEYRRTGNVPKALEQASFICEGASTHGVVEGYMMEQNWPEVTHEKLTEFVTTICQSVRNNGLVYGECLHGIGHALMFITGNDLPLSLKLCDALPLSPMSGATICYHGVFMENNLGAYKNASTASIHISDYLSRSDDPLYPCSILEERYLPSCYQFRADLSLRATGGDFDKAIETCLRVPQKHQSLCFYKVGQMAPDWIPEYVQVKAVCDKVYSLMGAAFRSQCIKGVVSAITWKYNGDANEVDLFCSLFEKKEKKRKCHDLAVRVLEDWADNNE